MAFKIVDIDDVKAQIIDRFAVQIFPDLIKDAVDNVTPDIVNAIMDGFRRTNLFEALTGALTGFKDRDLYAVLGLEENEGLGIVIAIESIIRESLELRNIVSRGGSGRFATINNATVLTFNLSLESLENNIENLNLSYDSKGGEVPWLQWLLRGGSTPGYNIIFGEFYTSRTGRAIMVKSPITWDIQDSDNFARERNFVVDILEDPVWPGVVEEIIIAEVDRLLDTGNYRIV